MITLQPLEVKTPGSSVQPLVVNTAVRSVLIVLVAKIGVLKCMLLNMNEHAHVHHPIYMYMKVLSTSVESFLWKHYDSNIPCSSTQTHTHTHTGITSQLWEQSKRDNPDPQK